jgi:hypothetical protein
VQELRIREEVRQRDQFLSGVGESQIGNDGIDCPSAYESHPGREGSRPLGSAANARKELCIRQVGAGLCQRALAAGEFGVTAKPVKETTQGSEHSAEQARRRLACVGRPRNGLRP